MPPISPPPRSPLAAYVATALALLIVYACLHPFAGWRASGLPPFDFLSQPWPHYYRGVELAVNVLGFIPFGFALVLALPLRLPRAAAVALTLLAGFALSLTVETLQNFLPSRVPSNVDLGCNALGALVGALAGARWGARLFAPRGLLARWRVQHLVPGRLGETGLVLLGLWLLTLMTSDGTLFATGDLRRLLDLPAPLAFHPRRFVKLESAITACQLLALGLTARCLLRPTARPWPVLALIACALVVKSAAAALVFAPGDPLRWATPGGQIGLAAGLAMLAASLALPARLHPLVAGLALLVGTALVNVAPQNPFALASPQRPADGGLLNFHGLAQLASSLWPFLAFAWLGLLGLRPPARRDGG